MQLENSPKSATEEEKNTEIQSSKSDTKDEKNTEIRNIDVAVSSSIPKALIFRSTRLRIFTQVFHRERFLRTSYLLTNKFDHASFIH